MNVDCTLVLRKMTTLRNITRAIGEIENGLSQSIHTK